MKLLSTVLFAERFWKVAFSAIFAISILLGSPILLRKSCKTYLPGADPNRKIFHMDRVATAQPSTLNSLRKDQGHWVKDGDFPSICKMRRSTSGKNSGDTENSLVQRNIESCPESLKTISIVFNPPDQMDFERIYPLELTLTINPSKKNHLKQMSINLADMSVKRTAVVPVKHKVKVVLNGDAFRIKPTTDEIQLIESSAGTVWKWKVTPTNFGSQLLDLTISVWIKAPDSQTPLVTELTNQRKIKVKISPIRQFFFSLKKLLEKIQINKYK